MKNKGKNIKKDPIEIYLYYAQVYEKKCIRSRLAVNSLPIAKFSSLC